MKKLILALSLLPLLFSCTSEKGHSAGGKFASSGKVVKPLMSERHIFNQDTIFALQDKASHDQLTRSKQLFMQAIDLYINQKKPAEAVKLFRESALYYPDLKTYNYLANAYIDVLDTLHADSSLISVEMGDYEGSYTLARLQAVKKDTSAAIAALDAAFQYGFANKKRFESDKVFDYLRAERSFVGLIVRYLKDDARLKQILFKSFLASAPEIGLPYTFNKDSICIINLQDAPSEKLINYDFATFIEGMESSQFSRDVSNEYYMVGRFNAGNNLLAVVYKAVVAIADTLPPVDVMMATYDSAGTLLDTKMIATYQLPFSLQTATITPDKEVLMTEYKMKWRTDPLEDGYAGNEYQGEELVMESRYVITEEGRFEPFAPRGKAEVVKK